MGEEGKLSGCAGGGFRHRTRLRVSKEAGRGVRTESEGKGERPKHAGLRAHAPRDTRAQRGGWTGAGSRRTNALRTMLTGEVSRYLKVPVNQFGKLQPSEFSDLKVLGA